MRGPVDIWDDCVRTDTGVVAVALEGAVSLRPTFVKEEVEREKDAIEDRFCSRGLG